MANSSSVNTEFPVGGKVISGGVATETTGTAVVHAAEHVIAPILDDVVARWIDDHIRSSPIAGATEAWNHLMGKLPILKGLLTAALTKKE